MLRALLLPVLFVASATVSLLDANGCCCRCGSPAEQAPAIEHAVQGKPRPELGAIEARIVARPTPDRTEVEATWRRHDPAAACELHLVLPEGATVLEGEAITVLPAATRTGTARWLIDFPTGAPLTLTVRLCGETPRGERVTECYLPLVHER